MMARCGGIVVGQLTGETQPMLVERSNALARVDRFDGLQTGELLELVRDLVKLAYRNYFGAATTPAPPVSERHA